MKVLYDHQIFSNQDFGGASLVFSEIIRNIRAAHTDVECEISSLLSGNINLESINPTFAFNFVRRFDHLNRKRIVRRINDLYTRFKLRQGGFDIFHPTYYSVYPLQLLQKKKTVVTVHDMTHEFYLTEKASDRKTIENKKFWIDNATKIIAVSENTKKDIIKLYGTSADKIEVVHNAGSQILDPKIYDEGNFASLLPQKYILYDGVRSLAYKNFYPFITAVAPLLKKLDVSVVCVGGGAFTPEEKNIFESLGISNLVVSIPLTNSLQMQAVFWDKATLYAYPSLYEGFGIPILQAFHMHCPVALSNRSSFPEVAQDAGFYFDPENSDEISAVVERALIDNEERTRKIKLGDLRVKDFTWQKAAEKTLAVYKSLY